MGREKNGEIKYALSNQLPLCALKGQFLCGSLGTIKYMPQFSQLRNKNYVVFIHQITNVIG